MFLKSRPFNFGISSSQIVYESAYVHLVWLWVWWYFLNIIFIMFTLPFLVVLLILPFPLSLCFNLISDTLISIIQKLHLTRSLLNFLFEWYLLMVQYHSLLNIKQTFSLLFRLVSVSILLKWFYRKSCGIQFLFPFGNLMQVVRSRLQEQGHHSEKRYSGVVDCVKKVFQQEGIPGFYRGCATNLLRTTPAAMITFTSFEMIHRFLVNVFPPDPHPQTLWVWNLR